VKAHTVIVIGITVALLVACGPGAPAPQQPTSPPPTEVPPTVEVDLEAAKALFVATCSACHGPDGKGIEGLGKDFTASEFVAQSSDAELVEFIKVGRAADDPLNTTGIVMPPKGGNPTLTDSDLLAIVTYIRSIQE